MLNNIEPMQSERFLIRLLEVSDVSLRYLEWFDDPTVIQFIQSAKHKQTLNDLRQYVQQKLIDENAFLFGIFAGKEVLHIGNIKFDPVHFQSGLAVVGAMVGAKDWRNKGVFKEVFLTMAATLNEKFGINTYWLGVERDNWAAIRAYRKTGFVEGIPPETLIKIVYPGCLYFYYEYSYE
jgi:RimJ/RimL family protein N-acetyltransferase